MQSQEESALTRTPWCCAWAQHHARWGWRRRQRLRGRGVSYCATGDGAFFRGKEVCVVGGGDTAMEDALYLARFASKVTIIHRRDSFRAAQALVRRVQQIAQCENTLSYRRKSPQGRRAAGRNCRAKYPQRGERSAFRTQGLFVAVGTVPQTESLAGQLALQEGYVIAGEDTRTSVRGVYAAGDIRTKPLRQVICAASDGAVAAALVQADLNSIEIG